MSFAAGYLVGRNAEASARSLEEAAASFGRILDRRQQAAQEASALEWCYARIAQWESWADMAMAEIQRLEADLTQSQECLAQSQKYAQWAGPEIERLKAQDQRGSPRGSESSRRPTKLNEWRCSTMSEEFSETTTTCPWVSGVRAIRPEGLHRSYGDRPRCRPSKPPPYCSHLPGAATATSTQLPTTTPPLLPRSGSRFTTLTPPMARLRLCGSLPWLTGAARSRGRLIRLSIGIGRGMRQLRGPLAVLRSAGRRARSRTATRSRQWRETRQSCRGAGSGFASSPARSRARPTRTPRRSRAARPRTASSPAPAW